MHGETRQITMPLELLAMGNGPDGDMRCGFMSRFIVNRSDFGVDRMKDSIGDSVAVTFCFQTIHQQPETEEKVDPFELGKAKPVGEFDKAADREKLKDLFR